MSRHRLCLFFLGVFGADEKPAQREQIVLLANEGNKISIRVPENATSLLDVLLKGGTPNMNTLDVQSVDIFAKKTQEEGGNLLMPKMAIPTVGWFATCQDTEGSTFGIIEFDKKAK